jgi:hypothetical protein
MEMRKLIIAAVVGFLWKRPELKEKADAATQSRLTRRYRKEIERYLGAEAMSGMEEETAAE